MSGIEQGQQQSYKNGAFHAVIFDLDGVLMDSEWLGFIAWCDVAKRCGGKLELSDYPGLIGLTAEETGIYVMQKANVVFDLPETIDWVVKEVTRLINEDLEPLPGARELVQTLADQGYSMAIASNSESSYIENALTSLGLLSYFDTRVGLDMVAQGKPAPDVYLEAARRLGVHPMHCVAIEDSRVGVQAAAAAGMRVLAVPSEHDHLHEFNHAWGVYKNLVHVNETLGQALM